ncbi:MAG TPA: hypothetical protein VGI83_09295 [Gemmatimonadales bacterium]
MTSDVLEPAGDRLIELLGGVARGPTRNAVFALWLFVHICEGLVAREPISDRTHQRRLQSLERRLSSLSLPAPLKRALAGGLSELAVGTAFAASVALYQLVAPVRENVGREAADAVALAARAARDAGSGAAMGPPTPADAAGAI